MRYSFQYHLLAILLVASVGAFQGCGKEPPEVFDELWVLYFCDYPDGGERSLVVYEPWRYTVRLSNGRSVDGRVGKQDQTVLFEILREDRLELAGADSRCEGGADSDQGTSCRLHVRKGFPGLELAWSWCWRLSDQVGEETSELNMDLQGFVGHLADLAGDAGF